MPRKVAAPATATSPSSIVQTKAVTSAEEAATAAAVAHGVNPTGSPAGNHHVPAEPEGMTTAAALAAGSGRTRGATPAARVRATTKIAQRAIFVALVPPRRLRPWLRVPLLPQQLPLATCAALLRAWSRPLPQACCASRPPLVTNPPSTWSP